MSTIAQVCNLLREAGEVIYGKLEIDYLLGDGADRRAEILPASPQVSLVRLSVPEKRGNQSRFYPPDQLGGNVSS